MQESNFEKQVQQKMDGLELKPSDEVWQKLSVNIAQRKSDRRVIVIIFFLLMLISSSLYIFRDQILNNKSNQIITGDNITVKSNIDRENNPAQHLQKIEHTPKSPVHIKDESIAPTGIKELKNIPLESKDVDQQKETSVADKSNASPTLATRNGLGSGPKPGQEAINGKSPANKNKDSKKVNGTITALATTGIPGEEVSDNDIVATREDALITGKNSVTIQEQLNDSGSTAKIDIDKLVTESLVALPATENKKNAAPESATQIKQSNKWEIGFNASLGIAATQKGFLGITGVGNSSKALFDPGQITNGNPGQPATTSHTPAELKSGPGLVLGMFVRKNISSKASLQVGLNYRYYSSSINVGNKVDSGFLYSFSGNNSGRANFYYSTGNSNSYKNSFHFAELPIAVQINLSKQSKRPVYLHSGISVALLLGTNALQFDTPSGSYYSNNDLFNKTQLSISTGLLFALSRRAINPFLIGPDINFSLNKMANSGLYSNSHYSYLGISLRKCIGTQ